MTLVVRWPSHNNRKMWLTNSHCTRRYGATDGDEWYQAFWSDGVIGYEAVDRLFGQGPIPDRHGYADVSMQSKNTFAPNRGALVGKIARTKMPYPTHVPEQSGSLEISTTHPTRSVVGHRTPIQGLCVAKTGVTTGTTAGCITQVDETIPGEEIIGGGGWERREQFFASYWSEPGDSGSPVWTYADSESEVYLVGQNWGSSLTQDPADQEGIFSRWPQVEHHVGDLCYTSNCE